MMPSTIISFQSNIPLINPYLIQCLSSDPQSCLQGDWDSSRSSIRDQVAGAPPRPAVLVLVGVEGGVQEAPLHAGADILHVAGAAETRTAEMLLMYF